MENLRNLIETLDDIERKNLLPEIREQLTELERYKREAERLEDARWNIIGKGYLPMERQMLYLTVEDEDSGERTLTEGFLEDGKWYNEGGASLRAKGLKVIAWIPKDVPKPCQGETE